MFYEDIKYSNLFVFILFQSFSPHERSCDIRALIITYRSRIIKQLHHCRKIIQDGPPKQQDCQRRSKFDVDFHFESDMIVLFFTIGK